MLRDLDARKASASEPYSWKGVDIYVHCCSGCFAELTAYSKNFVNDSSQSFLRGTRFFFSGDGLVLSFYFNFYFGGGDDGGWGV